MLLIQKCSLAADAAAERRKRLAEQLAGGGDVFISANGNVETPEEVPDFEKSNKLQIDKNTKLA